MRLLTIFLLSFSFYVAQGSEQKPTSDKWAGYRTTKTALKADPKAFKLDKDSTTSDSRGFLGITLLEPKPIIEEVAEGSPAEKAGLQKGDLIVKIGAGKVEATAAARDQLNVLSAGKPIDIKIKRGNKELTLTATPKKITSPLTVRPNSFPFADRAVMGINLGDKAQGGGVEVTTVTSGVGLTKLVSRKVTTYSKLMIKRSIHSMIFVITSLAKNLVTSLGPPFDASRKI